MKTADADLQVLLDKRIEVSGPVRGWVLYVDEGDIGLQLADGSHQNFGTSAFVMDGQWHHVVVTVDRDQPDGLEIYLDKLLVQTLDPTARQGTLSNTAPLTMGRRSDNPGWNGWLRGALDDVKLFDRALSTAEIQSL